MKAVGIYKITNPKGAIYIGQSIDCNRRKTHYKNMCCKDQSRIYNSIKKYGWESHKFEVIHECLPSELNDLEIYYISLFQCFNSEYGLNLLSGGGLNHIRAPRTKEHCDNISKGKKGNIPWNKGIKTGLQVNLGRKRPDNIERNKKRKGEKRSDETKKLMAIAHTGSPATKGSFTKEYWENIRLERNSMVF